MSEPTYLTEEGKIELERELDKLVNVRLPSLRIKLKEAVAQGDLKENADYHDTREKKALVDGRVQYIENILRTATIISNDRQSGIVGLGSTVTIRFKREDDDEIYKIVGAAEANPSEGRISNESPIGSVLIDRKVRDNVKVTTPNGEIPIKIKKIE